MNKRQAIENLVNQYLDGFCKFELMNSKNHYDRRGYYDYEADLIVIRKSRSFDEFVYLLCHEIAHAYQYKIRGYTYCDSSLEKTRSEEFRFDANHDLNFVMIAVKEHTLIYETGRSLFADSDEYKLIKEMY